MKTSNKSSPYCWNKAVSQPVKNVRYDDNVFKPYPIYMPKQKTAASQSVFHHQKFFDHPDYEYDNAETALNQNNFCLDSGFDRIQKSLINDLLGTEQRKGEEYFASSTAASIASSVFDLDSNDQESQEDESNQTQFESERGDHASDQFAPQKNADSKNSNATIDDPN